MVSERVLAILTLESGWIPVGSVESPALAEAVLGIALADSERYSDGVR